MKMKFKSVGLVLGALVFFASCQKTEIVKEEGLKSTTGDQTQVVEQDENTVATDVVFSKRYDASLTREEAEKLWEEDLKKFQASQPSSELKAYSTEWWSYVSTRTGTQQNNETDDEVGCIIRFHTSAGWHTSPYKSLDNKGVDDREGGWDFFALRHYIPGKAVWYVGVKSAYLYMNGTDGWFVTDFKVELKADDQTINARGYSSLNVQPNVWLDNSSSSGWDSYKAENKGSDYIIF